jgi:hypothetical protein
MMKITKAHIDAALQAGACHVPEEGTSIHEICQEDLVWAATHVPTLTPEERDLLYDLCGVRLWRVDGKCHRIDGPAIEWADGSKEWWVDGKRHHADGPAVEEADGRKEWWLNGKLHRPMDRLLSVRMVPKNGG